MNLEIISFVQSNSESEELQRFKESTQYLDCTIQPQGRLLKFHILKARSHDPFLRIQFLLVPKNGSCEHIKNDLPSNGSVILKKRMEIEHALFSSDTP